MSLPRSVSTPAAGPAEPTEPRRPADAAAAAAALSQARLLLPSVLTAREAPDALRMLVQALPRGPGQTAVVDASAVTQLDSAAIAVLLETRRRAMLAGLGFEVHGAPDKLVALARLYGVGELLAEPVAPAAVG